VPQTGGAQKLPVDRQKSRPILPEPGLVQD